VLLAPVTLGPAYPHVPKPYPPDAKSLHDTLEVDGRTVLYDLPLIYPAVATLAGQPATAFPVGLTRAGLPIGLQAVGPYLEDRTPIRFAALLEREFGGFTPPPGFA
jgi:amidase